MDATPSAIAGVVRRNTSLLSAAQALYTMVLQINVFSGPFIMIALTNDPLTPLAGLATAIAWGGRILIVYQSGKLMDRLGRIRVLRLGTLLSIAGALIVGFTLLLSSLVGVVAGLLVYGLGVGATQQNRVAVADMYPAGRRGQGLGYLLMASVLGAVATPLFTQGGEMLSGSLGYVKFSLSYFSVIWFSTVIPLAVALAFTDLVKTDPREIAEKLEKLDSRPQPDYGQDGILQNSLPLTLVAYPVLAAFAVSGLTQGNMTMNMALASQILHQHTEESFLITSAITLHIVGMYALSIPIGRMADSVGRRWTLLAGAFISGVGALLTPILTSFVGVTFGIVLVGVGWSFATVSTTALLSDLTAPRQRGRVIGVNDLVLGATAILFPIVGGIVTSFGGFSMLAMFGFAASLPTMGLAYFLREKRRWASVDTHLAPAG